MIKYLLKLFLIISISFTQISQSAELSNIAFIDIDYLIKNSEIGKKTLKILEDKNSENVKILKEKEKTLKNQENDLQSKKNIISTDEFNNEVKILKIKITELRSEKNLLAKNFNDFKNKELSELLKKYNLVIQEFMTKNSIEIIIDKKNIYIGKVTSDITNQILDEINNLYK